MRITLSGDKVRRGLVVGLALVLLELGAACRGGEAPAEPAVDSRRPDGVFAIVEPEDPSQESSPPSAESAPTPTAETAPGGERPSDPEAGDREPEDGEPAAEAPLDYDPELWLEVQALDPSIVLDIRYATEDNFVGEPLYPCGRCFLRPEAAAAVVEAHQALQEAGYGGLKLFDCYRPTPIQARLWEVSPDPRAVAPPSKGSMHNRGLAIDLTVIDREGQELDMGTAYDAFSERSYHGFRGLTAEVRDNRKALLQAMESAGFRPLKTEWWHYTLKGVSRPLADFVWSCTGPWPGGPRYWERR